MISAAELTAAAAPVASRSRGPATSGSPAAPGTAKIGLPTAAACLAVMSAPDAAVARTTTVAWESPAMVRFRRGKFGREAGVPGGSSVTKAPPAAAIRSNRAAFSGG